jgi:hypothetical protein
MIKVMLPLDYAIGAAVADGGPTLALVCPAHSAKKISPLVHRFLSFIKGNGRGEKRIVFCLFIGVAGYYSGASVRAYVSNNGGRERGTVVFAKGRRR